VDLLLGHHGRHGVDRGLQALVEIVVHAQVAVALVGVLPGHREHRVPLVDQELDHRIARAQVEDVVLHDPGRHDQHRLGMHILGGGRVLDDLDQVVAQDHLARRHRDGLAGFEGIGARLLAAFQGALDVLDQVLHAPHQVLPLFGLRQRLQFGVGQQAVGGGRRVARHARRKIQQLRVVGVQAADIVHRVLQQRLRVLVRAGQHVEGKLRPGRVVEALVRRPVQTLGGRHRLAAHRPQGKRAVVDRAAQRLLLQFHLARRRKRQVRRPVQPGRGEGRQ
jgi:hypothetical protein